MRLFRNTLVLLEDIDNDRADAISKWLAAQVKRLGVGDHVYVAGGAVRDFVLGKIPRDVDMVIDQVSSGKDSEWLANALSDAIPTRTKVTSNRYGASLLAISESWNLGGHEMKGEVLDIANAKAGLDKNPMKSHLKGFDFTFNTLMWRLADLAKGRDKAQIIDLTGCAMKDIKDGVMRCPRDAEETFSEDPSRLLRAVKFLVRYDRFKVPPKVAASIRSNASKLKNLPDNVVSALLTQELLVRKNYRKTIATMKKLGLLDTLADMVSTGALKKIMDKWSKSQDVGVIFEMIALGLPFPSPVGFLSPAHQRLFVKSSKFISPAGQKSFVDALKQPGKALKDKKFMASMATKAGTRMGRDFAQLFTTKARQVMLDSPRLVGSPLKLKDAIEQAF